ncbi:alkane 1-monooxygenase [Ophiostoma piceae UAMH 11346]|uniref:Alkane 1-monooxygenase n=1 Tax=Ophiostoma piceae (strain UAMH 11346) TaxID=1262450 RepID=S3C1D6_OPHP1|nr:alkane 1-monooxygenase [Ophiostoma piceae UAMH 11346]
MVQQLRHRDISTASQIDTSTDTSQPMQAPKQDTLLSPLPIVRGLGEHETVGRQRRKPSVQEMYNTWRALEEQVERIPRLPMFIKTESRFCHSCRILKRKCECFDYTQLEAVFQERNTALKEQALHQVPFTKAATPAARRSQTPASAAASAMPRARARTPVVNTKQAQALKQEPCLDVKQEDFDFNATMSVMEQPAQEPARTLACHARANRSSMTKCEHQLVVLAREKIGANARRWRCQFGSGTPGGLVCTREDDNMETIRRHYGREHGRHQYHKKPTVQIKCSACDFSVDNNQRPPPQCPACKTAHSIWLREMTAIIEVPVSVVDPAGEAVAPARARAAPTLPSTPQPASSSSCGTITAPTINVRPPSGAQFQPDYPPVNYLAGAAVPFAYPSTPLSPREPLTPGTPFTSTFSSFSPLIPFSPEIHSGTSFDTEVMSLFPYSHSMDSPQQSGLENSYTAGMPFATDACTDSVSHNNHNSLALRATTHDYSGLYNTTLDPAMVATEAPYLQAPSEGQYLQQPYINLTGPAMADDGMQMMGLMNTDFF